MKTGRKDPQWSSLASAVALCAAALLVLPACFNTTDVDTPHRPENARYQFSFSGGETIMVLAGRAGEEILFAGGVIWNYPNQTAVCVLTNRDEHNSNGGPVTPGIEHLRESRDFQIGLGLPAANMFFFSYPSDALLALYNDYPETGQFYTTQYGETSTYSNLSRHRPIYPTYVWRADVPYSYHRTWTVSAGTEPFYSQEAPYNGAALTEDLAQLIRVQRPAHILTNSPFDGHPDNRATYLFLVEALKQARASDSSIRPAVYSAIVHWPERTNFNDYWEKGLFDSGANCPAPTTFYPSPNGSATLTPMEPPKNFSTLVIPYWRNRRVWLSDAEQWREIQVNPLYSAIASGTSFLVDSSTFEWAEGFVKRDAPFFDHNLGNNEALRAVATASDSNPSLSQTPERAIDGVVDGLHGGGGDMRKEWVAGSQTTSAWLHLAWPSDSVTVTGVILYDRPNTRDQVTSGRLYFNESGSFIPFGELPDTADTGLYVPVNPPATAGSLRIQITGCKEGTLASGLSEVEVISSP